MFQLSHHHHPVNSYGISVSEMTTDLFHCRNHKSVLSSFITYHWVCFKRTTTSVTGGAGTDNPPGVPSRFYCGLCCLCYHIT